MSILPLLLDQIFDRRHHSWPKYYTGMKDWSKTKHIITNVMATKILTVMSWWKFSTLYWVFHLLMDLELFFQFCNNFFFILDHNFSIVPYLSWLKNDVIQRRILFKTSQLSLHVGRKCSKRFWKNCQKSYSNNENTVWLT